MGRGDLAHQLEARTVSSTAIRFQLAGWLRRYRSNLSYTALHKENDCFLLGSGS